MHVEIENEDCINIQFLLREPHEKFPKYFSLELRVKHLIWPSLTATAKLVFKKTFTIIEK